MAGDPSWYKDAIIYQLHIKAFFDADDNGIGDLRGLKEKLDYLQRLGVNCLWLLPFYPSPQRDDGYDIADYYGVHPDYNDLAAFKHALKAAHRRGIRVVTELVLNHTSDQHPWFQRARRAAPDSSFRDFYLWSDTPEPYREARIIFKDFESSNWSWDPAAGAYYWHRFYSHQPDLNFDNPAVRKEMLRAIDFWLDMGVDGLRLDAVPYLFEREGTNCENLPETHDFLKKVRAHVDGRFEGRMLLAEANQWPEDAAAYFGAGDECHMAFHFPIMPRMFMALQMEDRFPLVDILDQTPAIPESCQWAIFLRNHDELTLEMVTDEERDYMYRVYADDPRARINLGIRRRLAPLMGNSRRRIELMNFLLMSLPGTPIIYYGDEIGMGDNYYLGDRNGVRTPMQWSPDRNAGFSRASPQKLYLPVIIEPEYHYESINVENQERNPSSLLWWMRRVIAMRRRYPAFGRGSLEILYPDNPKVLAFLRLFEEKTLLVVVNLSRFAQVARIDLAPHAGLVPEEVFSRNRYPVIKDAPYILTLGVHDYYWFHLREDRAQIETPEDLPRLALESGRSWHRILEEPNRERFEIFLAAYLPACRWFRSKARSISETRLLDAIPLGKEEGAPRMVTIRVSYREGEEEIYALPLAWLPLDHAGTLLEETPRSRIAPLRIGQEEGILFDAVFDESFRKNLLRLLTGKKKLRGGASELLSQPARGAMKPKATQADELLSRPLMAEQSNSSILYGDRFFLKLYRKLEGGANPDPELVRFLTENARFPQVPPFAGTIEYHRPGEAPAIIAMLQGIVPNQGDAWHFTLDVLHRFFEQVLAHRRELPPLPEPSASLGKSSMEPPPESFLEFLGSFFPEMMALLGRRTAEMHLALASAPLEGVWAPEEFSTLYQRSLYQSTRSLLRRTFALLQAKTGELNEADRKMSESLLASESGILKLFGRILEKKVDAMKIRIHGDYHLGQALFTGKDFAIIDFEGEPGVPLGERRLKRSPLKDVAGMLRSFHYAAHTAQLPFQGANKEENLLLGLWGNAWVHYVSKTFFDAYLRRLDSSPLIPRDPEALELLLETFLLEKAIYELGYELNNRPAWVFLPLIGIEEIIRKKEGPTLD